MAIIALQACSTTALLREWSKKLEVTGRPTFSLRAKMNVNKRLCADVRSRGLQNLRVMVLAGFAQVKLIRWIERGALNGGARIRAFSDRLHGIHKVPTTKRMLDNWSACME